MLVTLTSRGWTTKGVLLRKHCRLLTVERYINLLFDADRTNAHAKETHTESAYKPYRTGQPVINSSVFTEFVVAVPNRSRFYDLCITG